MAEDIVQDLFCDLWNRRRGWHPKGTVKAYLYRAARNKSLNWLKHRRVVRRWEVEKKRREPSHQENPEHVLWRRELEKSMRQAVEALPERRRLVYTMARQEGMSYVEIADVLDIAPKTVENQMGRALKFLRKQLSTFFPFSHN